MFRKLFPHVAAKWAARDVEDRMMTPVIVLFFGCLLIIVIFDIGPRLLGLAPPR